MSISLFFCHDFLSFFLLRCRRGGNQLTSWPFLLLTPHPVLFLGMGGPQVFALSFFSGISSFLCLGFRPVLFRCVYRLPSYMKVPPPPNPVRLRSDPQTYAFSRVPSFFSFPASSCFLFLGGDLLPRSFRQKSSPTFFVFLSFLGFFFGLSLFFLHNPIEAIHPLAGLPRQFCLFFPFDEPCDRLYLSFSSLCFFFF